MPSTYSPNLRIELIGTGEQSGTWGLTTNSNLGTIIESAISGYVVVTTTSANQALTALNGAADEARNMILELNTTTSAPYNVYIPNAEKFYVVRNASEYPVTIYCSTVLGNTTAAGDGVIIPGATVSGTIPTTFQICTDGTDVYDALNSFAGPLTVSGDVTLGNRFSATYSKPSSGSSTVTVTTTVAHGYSTGNIIQFIPTTGSPEFVPGGDYTITVTGPTTFTFTASTTQASISGSAFVTDDTITLNGVVQPGVVIASDTGTTYPALRITQVGTGAALLVEDNTNPDASPFLITGGGQVIKGYTEAISSKNSTGGGTLTFDTQVIGTSEATSGIGVFNYSTNTGLDPSISFNKSLNATVGDHTAVTDGTQLGVIGFAGSDAGAGNAQAFQSGAYIMGAADDNATAGSVPGRLIFATTLAGNPNPTERMRINNQGRVGINATSLTNTGFRINQALDSSVTTPVRQMYLEGAITSIATDGTYGSAGLEVQSTWNQNNEIMSNSISNGGWVRGVYSSPALVGTSGTVAAASAFVAEVQNTGTGGVAGTLTNAIGFNAANVTTNGTLTNAYAFYVASNWTNATNNYGFYSDIDTAANRWNFYAAGTASNYFGGNTIISVTDNTNAALRITQLGTGDALVVEDNTNPDNTPFVIDSDGKTIRGFGSPQTVRISTTAIVPSLQNLGTSATDSSLLLGGAITTNSTAPYLFFAKWASGTVGNNATVVAADESLGYISWSGSDGSNQTQAASISAFVDGTVGSGDMPGRLVFSTTADGEYSPTERLLIDSLGRMAFNWSGALGGGSAQYRFAGNITGAASSTGVAYTPTIKSDVGTLATIISSQPSIDNVAFSLTDLRYFVASQGTITGGSRTPPTNQAGFFASSNIIGASSTNYGFYSANIGGASATSGKTNYGFYSDVDVSSSSGTAYGFYAGGTAPNYFGGNTVISVTDNTNAALKITQAGTGNLLYLEDASSDSTPIVVNAVGEIVVGHTSVITGAGSVVPRLQVVGTTQGTTGTSGSVSSYCFNASLTSGPVFDIGFSKNNSIGTFTGLVVADDTLGSIRFSGSNGSTFARAAQIFSQVDTTASATISSTSMPGRLVFSTTSSGSTAPTERLRITNNGRIQINGANILETSMVAISGDIGISTAATLYQFRADAVPNLGNTSVVSFGATHSFPSTANPKTYTSSYGFLLATIPPLNANITLTNNYGLFVDDQSQGDNVFGVYVSPLTGAKSYGVFSNVASGTDKWNFYANGTAANYFLGNVGIGTNAPTARLTLAAGGTAVSSAPLKFTSGSVQNASEAGTIEYDGTSLYATTNASFKRGTIPVTNYTSGVGTSLTATSENTLAVLLPSSNNTITLPIGTYFLDLSCTFTRGTVSTTPSQAQIKILGTGNAAGTFSGMSLSSAAEGGAASNFSFNAVNISTVNTVTASSNVASSVYTINLRGILKITTAGTIVPQYCLSVNLASAGTATAPRVLYFKLQQLDTQSATAFGPADTGWN